MENDIPGLSQIVKANSINEVYQIIEKYLLKIDRPFKDKEPYLIKLSEIDKGQYIEWKLELYVDKNNKNPFMYEA